MMKEGEKFVVMMPDADTGFAATTPVLMDTSGDGVVDMVGIDTNNDGTHDVFHTCVPIDTNGDGKFDSVA